MIGSTVASLTLPAHSYKKLRAAVTNEDPAHWLQAVEATAWLEYLRLILVGAIYIIEKLEVEQASVLCHCSTRSGHSYFD